MPLPRSLCGWVSLSAAQVGISGTRQDPSSAECCPVLLRAAQLAHQIRVECGPYPPSAASAAILSADIAGYSRLMAEDETIRMVTARRQQVELLLEQHRGRLVDRGVRLVQAGIGGARRPRPRWERRSAPTETCRTVYCAAGPPVGGTIQ